MPNLIRCFLLDGIVETSTSLWSSLIVIVKKKDGSYRICIDYRKLSKVTERDVCLTYYISFTLDKLHNRNYLTFVNIKSAYWYVLVFATNRGLF